MQRAKRDRLQALLRLAQLDLQRGYHEAAALKVLDALRALGVKGGEA